VKKSVHATAATGLEQPREKTGATRKRAMLGKVLGWGFVACAVVVGAFAARSMFLHPRSGTETKVMANAIGIAPRVSGPIKSLPLNDDQEVRKGDVLFEIDPEPYELAARVARANRDAVAGEILNVERAIAAQNQAEDSLRRVEPLLAKNYATADSVEKARNARDTAVAAVNAAKAQLSAAEFAVQDIAPVQAKLKAAEAALAEAELHVRDCTVRAPFDGRVAGLNISAGAFARTAIDTVTLIDMGDWHVEANFRESELGAFRPAIARKFGL
jgi:multidrug efflux system membrane fusion protein